MDFGSVLSLASEKQQKQRPVEKRFKTDFNGPRKERREKDGRPKSEFLQRAFQEKEEERKRKELEEKQRQKEEERKKVFRIPKKPRPAEEDSSLDKNSSTDKNALSEEEKRERARKLASIFSNKNQTDKNKHSSNKSNSSKPNHKKSESSRKSSGNDHKKSTSDTKKSSSEIDHRKSSSESEHRKSSSERSSEVKKSEKKPSYLEKLEKLSDQEKLAIIKKISGTLGRQGDKISDEEKLDKIRKISETIGKGSTNTPKHDTDGNTNGIKKISPLSGKIIDRNKFATSIESLQQMKKDLKETEEQVAGSTITMLGKTDEGIKREVKHFDRSDAEKMRLALQEKAARIKAMMSQPDELKPKERKKRQTGNKTDSEDKSKRIKSKMFVRDDDRSPSPDPNSKEAFKVLEKEKIPSERFKKSSDYSRISEKRTKEEKPVEKKKRPPPPPSMNFNDLLKMAQEKSKEPVKIEVKKPVKEEEKRPMTKKELERQREYQEYLHNKKNDRHSEREERVEVKKEKQDPVRSKSTSNLVSKSNHSEKSSHSKNTPDVVRRNPYADRVMNNDRNKQKSSSPVPSSSSLKKSASSSTLSSRPFSKDLKFKSPSNGSTSHIDKKIKTEHSSSERRGPVKEDERRKPSGAKSKNYSDVRENVLVCGPSKNEKKEKPTSSNPFDRIYGEIKKNHPSKPVKRKHPDEYTDSEDEFDEDLEDFVVDYLSSGEEEEMEEYDNDYDDYSKHIRNIFGYDKRKFKYESDYDIANMESGFRECMKEEARSARLGMQEDLEDIRREEEELKRKKKKR